MEIKDLAGLSKPLTKLIEVISQGIGAISKPYLLKKTADAKAYEINKISQAIKENQMTLESIDFSDNKLDLKSLRQQEIISLQERTNLRLEFQELKKQLNIENIIQKTASQLQDESEVSNDPVDEDWTTRFFNYAKDISNEEMQNLWSQILAGEIKKPKSYSLRTLHLLRNLSKEEAEVFIKVSNYVIKVGNDEFLFKGNGKILEKFGISFNDISLLKEIGLLQSGDLVNFNMYKTNTTSNSVFVFGNKVVILEKQKDSKKKSFSIIPLTNIGKELLKLVQINPDFKYIQTFASELKDDTISMKYASIIEFLPDSVRHTVPLLEIPEIND